MIITIHQPAYLPWMGYFHKIALSDIFVFFDTTQFEKNSFINRNKIKTAQGKTLLSIPVNLKDHMQKEIREIEITGNKWQKKHWKTIELNYKKTKYWDKYASQLEKLYQRDYKTIDQVCYDQLIFFIKVLGIKTKIIKSSDLPKFNSNKQELIIDICKELKANFYISGALGRDYINNQNFIDRGINLYYQYYQHPKYEQLWEKFLPYMSIIDLLFNYGNKSLKILMSNNITKQDLLTNSKLYE